MSFLHTLVLFLIALGGFTTAVVICVGGLIAEAIAVVAEARDLEGDPRP